MCRKGYGSRSVCLCVCYHSNCHILGLYVENNMPLGFSWQSQRMYCVDFVKNALFKSFGNINFADHHRLLRLFMSSRSIKRTVIDSFQD
jgi:hypothetical protein